MTSNFEKYQKLADNTYFQRLGKVVKIVGLTIESVGPDAKLNDLCRIVIDKNNGTSILAEVVGFRDKRLLLMPFESVEGIGVGCIVENTGHPLSVLVGDELLGHTVDGVGRPTDLHEFEKLDLKYEYPVEAAPPDPMSRKIIDEVLPLGVKAVDALITIGKGQRIGIFAGSGVGKSTLLGMFARNTKADINVIALVGERGREVREFIERDLGEEGMKRSIVVVATSDKPALIRSKAAKTATAIAEYFRDLGKDVVLMMDNVTRFAKAQQEIGTSNGELPIHGGYPPSVFDMLPKLMERTGTNDKGSITAFYNVLVDSDDMNEPITDAVRGILDGHIVLSRKLAQAYHYPAIDVLASISRLSKRVSGKMTQKACAKIRTLMATYQNNEAAIVSGIYAKGNSPAIDEAIDMHQPIEEFLTQEEYEPSSMKETLDKLASLSDVEIPETEYVEAPALVVNEPVENE